MEFITIPVIIILVYLIIDLYKVLLGKKELAKNLIPIIAAILGITFSVLIWIFYPEQIPSDNLITTIMIGITSGLSATGSNQVIKQTQEMVNKLKS